VNASDANTDNGNSSGERMTLIEFVQTGGTRCFINPEYVVSTMPVINEKGEKEETKIWTVQYVSPYIVRGFVEQINSRLRGVL